MKKEENKHMKKQAIGTIIKDLAIILILGGIMAFILIPDAGMGAGAKLFFWLAITGIPFGWKWASKIFTAITLKGIAFKVVFSALLGCIAIFVVLIGDIIRLLVAQSGEKTES